MSDPTFLDYADKVSSVVTGLIAVYGIWEYQRLKWRSKIALERYLKSEKKNSKDGKKGQHTVMHLVGRLGMSEAMVLDAAFSNKRKIKTTVGTNSDAEIAKYLLLEYVPSLTPWPRD
jgi:hypothetical protein